MRRGRTAGKKKKNKTRSHQEISGRGGLLSRKACRVNSGGGGWRCAGLSPGGDWPPRPRRHSLRHGAAALPISRPPAAPVRRRGPRAAAGGYLSPRARSSPWRLRACSAWGVGGPASHGPPGGSRRAGATQAVCTGRELPRSDEHTRAGGHPEAHRPLGRGVRAPRVDRDAHWGRKLQPRGPSGEKLGPTSAFCNSCQKPELTTWGHSHWEKAFLAPFTCLR